MMDALSWTALDVMVDGRSVGAKSSYTFERITSGHKISASFMAMSNLARSRGAGFGVDYLV